MPRGPADRRSSQPSAGLSAGLLDPDRAEWSRRDHVGYPSAAAAAAVEVAGCAEVCEETADKGGDGSVKNGMTEEERKNRKGRREGGRDKGGKQEEGRGV